MRFVVLDTLEKAGTELPMVELVNITGISRGTLQTAANAMEIQGLVHSRKQGRGENRPLPPNRYLRITPKGRKAWREVIEFYREFV